MFLPFFQMPHRCSNVRRVMTRCTGWHQQQPFMVGGTKYYPPDSGKTGYTVPYPCLQWACDPVLVPPTPSNSEDPPVLTPGEVTAILAVLLRMAAVAIAGAVWRRRIRGLWTTHGPQWPGRAYGWADGQLGRLHRWSGAWARGVWARGVWPPGQQHPEDGLGLNSK